MFCIVFVANVQFVIFSQFAICSREVDKVVYSSGTFTCSQNTYHPLKVKYLAFYACTDLIAGLAGARNGSLQHGAPEFMVRSALVYKCTLAI